MKIEPIKLADFDLVEVKSTNQCAPTPHCKKHGAMNKITKDGIWRRMSLTGYQPIYSNNGASLSKKHMETICRAGCCEAKTE